MIFQLLFIDNSVSNEIDNNATTVYAPLVMCNFIHCRGFNLLSPIATNQRSTDSFMECRGFNLLSPANSFGVNFGVI